jgi:hypothetical protein
MRYSKIVDIEQNGSYNLYQNLPFRAHEKLLKHAGDSHSHTSRFPSLGKWVFDKL